MAHTHTLLWSSFFQVCGGYLCIFQCIFQCIFFFLLRPHILSRGGERGQNGRTKHPPFACPLPPPLPSILTWGCLLGARTLLPSFQRRCALCYPV